MTMRTAFLYQVTSFIRLGIHLRFIEITV